MSTKKYVSLSSICGVIGLLVGAFHALTRDGISLVNPTSVIVATYIASPILGYISGKLLGLLAYWWLNRPRGSNHDTASSITSQTLEDDSEQSRSET